MPCRQIKILVSPPFLLEKCVLEALMNCLQFIILILIRYFTKSAKLDGTHIHTHTHIHQNVMQRMKLNGKLNVLRYSKQYKNRPHLLPPARGGIGSELHIYSKCSSGQTNYSVRKYIVWCLRILD